MIEVHKFIHGIYKSGHNLLPLAPSSALRGHIGAYTSWRKGIVTLNQLRSNFFSFRVVNLWNNLLSDVVSAPSMNAFNERLEGVLLYTGAWGFYSTITT